MLDKGQAFNGQGFVQGLGQGAVTGAVSGLVGGVVGLAVGGFTTAVAGNLLTKAFGSGVAGATGAKLVTAAIGGFSGGFAADVSAQAAGMLLSQGKIDVSQLSFGQAAVFGLLGAGIATAGVGVRALKLRVRARELAFDPERNKPDFREGFGGARIEQSTGRNIIRASTAGADFVDPVLGPISLKGPLLSNTGKPILVTPDRLEGLGRSVIKDVNFNTATKAVVVDTFGLSVGQVSLLKAQILQGATTAKSIIFLPSSLF